MWTIDSQFGRSQRSIDLSDSVRDANQLRRWSPPTMSVAPRRLSTHETSRPRLDDRWMTESRASYTYYVSPEKTASEQCISSMIQEVPYDSSKYDDQTLSYTCQPSQTAPNQLNYKMAEHEPHTQQGSDSQNEAVATNVPIVDDRQNAQPLIPKLHGVNQSSNSAHPNDYNPDLHITEVPVDLGRLAFTEDGQGIDTNEAKLVDGELSQLYAVKLEQQQAEQKQRESERRAKEAAEQSKQRKALTAKEKRARKALAKQKKAKRDAKALSARLKREEAKRKIQTSRALPDSGFSKHFHKPPFHMYGHGNTAPVNGGLTYGNYMSTFNIKPLLHPSDEKHEEAMENVNFVYDSAVLHFDPSRYANEERPTQYTSNDPQIGSTDEDGNPQPVEEGIANDMEDTLLATAKEKLQETYGGAAEDRKAKRASMRAKHSSITEQMTLETSSPQKDQRTRSSIHQSHNLSNPSFNKPQTTQTQFKTSVSSTHNPLSHDNSKQSKANKPYSTEYKQSIRVPTKSNKQRGRNHPRTKKSNGKKSVKITSFDKVLDSRHGSPTKSQSTLNRWMTQKDVAEKQTGVVEPDETEETKQKLQARLNAATSALFHVPMRFRRSWSSGVRDSLTWNPEIGSIHTAPPPIPNKDVQAPAIVNTTQGKPYQNTLNMVDEHGSARSHPMRQSKVPVQPDMITSLMHPYHDGGSQPQSVQEHANVLWQDAQTSSRMQINVSVAHKTSLLDTKPSDTEHENMDELEQGTETQQIVDTVPVLTSSYRPRANRERDPRAYKYLPADWTRIIRPAGRATVRSGSAAEALYMFD